MVRSPLERDPVTLWLDEAPFRHWVRQDYVYFEYSRVFAHGAAKAPTLERMGTFADLLDSTLNTGMDRHRDYVDEYGTSIADTSLITAEVVPRSINALAPALVPTIIQDDQPDRITE